MGKKGGRRKGDDDFEKDFMQEDDEQAQEAVEPTAATAKKKKDKKKDKKKGKAAAFDSDEDEPKLLAAAAGSDEEEEEPPARAAPPKKKGGKAKAAPASMFALLQHGDDDEAEEVEEEEEEEGLAAPKLRIAEILSVDPHPKAERLRVVTLDAGAVGTVKVVTNAPNVEEGMKVVLAPVGSTTPGSGLKIERASLRGVESHGMLCSAYDIGWVREPDGVLVELPEDVEVGEECPEEPPAGTKFGKAAPGKEKKSKGKGKKKDADSLLAALAEEGEGGTAAAEEEADGEAEEEPAPNSKKDKKKKGGGGGKKEGGSLFAALAEDGGEEEGAAAAAEEEAGGDAEAEPAPKSKKDKKKKGGGFDAAFAALSLDEEAAGAAAVEEGDGEGEGAAAEKKKKKKDKKELDSVFAALGEGEDAAPAADVDDEVAAALKAGKKKSKKKALAADVDFDALLGEAEEEAPAPAPAEMEKKGKKEKKGKGCKAAEEEEDLDALLAELDGPMAVPAAAPAAAAPAAEAGGKGKKKKGKGGAKDEVEDLDAILAELGAVPAAAPAAAPVAAAPVAEPGAAAATPPAEAAGAEGEEGEGGDKEMSAAAKRKAKRKAKEKAKKEGGAAPAEAEGEEEAADKKGGKKAAGGAKVSAAVRRMQEALEAQRRAQEEAERLAEEQRRREEEEERRREEEEKRRAEEAERRRQEKAERRAQLKKEGKLLTGKAKAEAERLARARELFLRQAGIDPDAVAAPKKKPVYDRKKKQQPKKGAEAAEQQQEEAVEAQAEAPMQVEAAAAAKPAAAAVAAAEPAEAPSEPAAEQQQPQEEAAADSWEEAAADDWEAMDLDEIKLPVQQANGKAQEPPTHPPAAEAEAKEAAAAAAAAEASEGDEGSEGEEGSESEEESEEGSSEEGSTSEYSSSEEESSEYSSSEDESESDSEEDSEDEMEARVAAARGKREAALAEALAHRDANDLRSPICCILGHVDTGKTKILDNIRRTNVQDGEAGGITQQIGATYIPAEAIKQRTEELRKGRQFELKLPGLLVIDTPGHESFSNLRSRGSGLCDIAILVVDLMHGLEQQTIESINLLKMRKTPFIIAMNKVDRLYDWKPVPNSPIQDALARQGEHVRMEFENRLSQVSLQLNEQGLNVALYWRNKDPNTYHSIVPTSAITGEGISDMLQLMVKLTQSLMVERLMFVNHLQCTVLEVKQIEGLGTTIDVVLVNGQLKEGDTIVVCGLGGPIVTTIRALLTPHPLRELRVKGSYQHHKSIRAAMGVKIAAHNLESAVAGTQLYVAGPDDDVEAIKEEVMEDMTDIFSSVDKTGEGVCVQASTLGSLEALLEFLKSPEVAIPVSAINIGPVHKKDVMRANVMIERGAKKFGVILAFDVPVTKEARELAEDMGVRIFTADIIYHLFDQFTAYLKQVKEEEQEAAKLDAVFPCVLKILPTCIFNKKDPIVLGVEVAEGVAKIGTPLCVPTQGGIDLGRIASMEKDHKAVDTAKRGDTVAMKIEATNPTESQRLYGRHFDFKDELVSKISRKSINVLKEMFRDEMSKDDWKLVIKLKKVFKID